MTQMMMFYCKEVRDENRDFYDEVCKPIYNIVKEHADDNNPVSYTHLDFIDEWGQRDLDRRERKMPVPENDIIHMICI